MQRQDPFVNPPVNWLTSIWLPLTLPRLLFALATYLAFVILFAPFHQLLGNVAGGFASALGLVPAVVAGWLLGKRIGLLVGVCAVLTTYVLFRVIGDFQWVELVVPGLTGALAIISLGFGAGWMSERLARAEALTARVKREEQGLQREKRELELAQVELQKQNEYYNALHETALGLVGRLEVGGLLEQIVSRAGALVGTTNGYVFLLDPATQEMEMRVGVGAYAEFVGTKTRPGRGLAGKVWASGEPIAVDDYRTWPDRLQDSRRDILRAVVGIPLQRQGLTEPTGNGSRRAVTVIGVIGLAFLDDKHTFGPPELDVLNRFASLATIALDNAQLYQAAQHDLTERQRTEMFLTSLVESLPTMLFVKEAKELRFVRWNKAGEELTGNPRSAYLGKNDYDFFPKEQADFFVAKDRETLESGQVLDIPEEPIQTANGSLRWLHTRKVPLLGADGKPEYLLGISEDITDRKRAEQQLRESEERYRDLFENANDLIQSVDGDGHFVFVNRAWKQVLGYTEDDLASLTFLDVIHPDERKHCLELFGRVMRGHALPDLQTVFVTKDGRPVLIEGSTTPRLEGGQVISTRGIFRDVTLTKQAEAATRESETRLAAQNAYLNALQETTVGMMSRLDVSTLLQDIVTRAGALVGTDHGYVFLKEPGADEMVLRVGVGAYEGFVGRRTRAGVGLAGQVWEKNEPVVVDDYRHWADRLADPSRDILRAVVGVPLRSGSQPVGVIGLAYLDEGRKFGEQEIQVLQRFAQLAAIALDNARLFETAQQELAERTRAEREIRQRNEELEVISRVSAIMTTNLDLTTALGTLARELVNVFKARNCGIALLNRDRTDLTVVADALSEEHEEHSVGIVIPLQGNLSSQYVINERRSLVIRDAQTDPMTEPIHERMRQRRTRCLAIIPLLSGGEVIGTIGLDTTDPDHVFTEQEIRLAEMMANQMANALEKQRLFDQTRQRARREQLTREINADVSRSLDRETILRTMARDLSHALGASHAVVHVGVRRGDGDPRNSETDQKAM